MNPRIAMALSMLARQSCLAAVLLGGLTRPLVAQEPAGATDVPTAAAPSYKVGDTWTYLWGRTDTRRGDVLVLTVVAVTATQTTMSSTWNGGAAKEVDYDSQGNVTRDGNGTTYEPSTGDLSFPLTVGKSWDFHNIRRFTGGSLDVRGTSKVVAFERVTVAAGSFDAYKIKTRGINAKQLERMYSAPFTNTFWYAPSVKRIIKWDYALYLGHEAQIQTKELSAFSLAP